MVLSMAVVSVSAHNWESRGRDVNDAAIGSHRDIAASLNSV